MRRLGWLCVVLLCGAGSSPTLWRHAARLTPGDPTQLHGELGGWLRSVAAGWDVDPSLSEQLRGTREALFTLDLKRLYNHLPGEGETHSLHVEGHPTRGPYRLLAGDGVPLQMGGLTVDLALTPLAVDRGPRAWSAEPRLGLATGSVGPAPLVDAVSAVLLELEAVAREGDADAAVRGALDRTFPELSAALTSVLTVEGLVADDPASLVLDARFALVPDGFRAQGMPELARYLERLDDLVQVEVALRDDADRTVLEAALDTRTLRIALRTRVHEARFVPWGPEGPAWGDAIPLDGDHALTMRVEGTVQAEGVVLDLPGWDVPVDVHLGAERARATARLVTVPELTISGGGRTMDWLVGLADAALGLEDKGRALFETLAEGPEGNGSTVTLQLDDAQHVLWIEARLALLEEGLVRLALRITARRLMPDAATTSDLSRWLSQLAGALEMDRAEAENARL